MNRKMKRTDMKSFKKEYLNKLRIIRHIQYCRRQVLEILISNKNKKTYYFKKQIEVAKRKL